MQELGWSSKIPTIEHREKLFTEQVKMFFEGKGFEVKRGYHKGRSSNGIVIPDLILNDRIAVEVKYMRCSPINQLVGGLGQCVYYLLEYSEAYLVVNELEGFSYFNVIAIKKAVPNLHLWVITKESGLEVTNNVLAIPKTDSKPTIVQKILEILEEDKYYTTREVQQMLPDIKSLTVYQALYRMAYGGLLEHSALMVDNRRVTDKRRVTYWSKHSKGE